MWVWRCEDVWQTQMTDTTIRRTLRSDALGKKWWKMMENLGKTDGSLGKTDGKRECFTDHTLAHPLNRLEAPESDAGEKLMGKVMKNDGEHEKNRWKTWKKWWKMMENLGKTDGKLGKSDEKWWKTWEKQMEHLGKTDGKLGKVMKNDGKLGKNRWNTWEKQMENSGKTDGTRECFA